MRRDEGDCPNPKQLGPAKQEAAKFCANSTGYEKNRKNHNTFFDTLTEIPNPKSESVRVIPNDFPRHTYYQRLMVSDMKITPNARKPKAMIWKKMFVAVWNKLPHGFRMRIIGDSQSSDLEF
ncbi:hypothetical protein [Leptospira broomii]|nr:hypothetical protein [Leptospira broomii]